MCCLHLNLMTYQVPFQANTFSVCIHLFIKNVSLEKSNKIPTNSALIHQQPQKIATLRRAAQNLSL